jgi:hypothetical protein
MNKLTSELRRLYLFGDQPYDKLAPSIDLVNDDGMVRTLVIDFHKAGEEQHWVRLCDVANALQTKLGLPAPAVSVDGGSAFRLWLSLEKPVAAAQAKQFLALLHKGYFEDDAIDLGRSRIDLPPGLNRATGLWSAFINPSMGGALAEDLGLEMAPPESPQAAFLESLHSISEEAFTHALATLLQQHDTPAQAAVRPATSTTSTTPQGLLLQDATLEDIVRHLHAMGIEPTFRHVLKN